MYLYIFRTPLVMYQRGFLRQYVALPQAWSVRRKKRAALPQKCRKYNADTSSRFLWQHSCVAILSSVYQYATVQFLPLLVFVPMAMQPGYHPSGASVPQVHLCLPILPVCDRIVMPLPLLASDGPRPNAAWPRTDAAHIWPQCSAGTLGPDNSSGLRPGYKSLTR